MLSLATEREILTCGLCLGGYVWSLIQLASSLHSTCPKHLNISIRFIIIKILAV